MFTKVLLCALVAAVAARPQGYGPPPPPGSAPGGFGGRPPGGRHPPAPQRPSSGFGPPPGSAPGGFGGRQPPAPPRPSGFGPPPGSAPGGFGGSQPPAPPRPSGFGPPPFSAPGGIGGSQPPAPQRPSGGIGGSYRPQGGPSGTSGPVVPILVDERDGPHADGSYSFNFETGDGISRHEQGTPQGETGAVAQQGGWSFTFPDGTPAVFNFVADENGYRVESDLLPTPHPLPAHAIAQIEKARLEDAAAAAGGAPSSGGSYGPSPPLRPSPPGTYGRR